MKELIRHLVRVNIEEIVSKSLFNCHAMGVHSIMLLESPGKTIRVFIATKDHQLNKNLSASQGEYYNRMSVGFHPHHCDITLHCVYGEIQNWIVTEHSFYGDNYLVRNKYKYHSKITDNEMSFELIGEKMLSTVSDNRIQTGESVFMKAHEIHTVGVEKGKEAAWFVYEGKEDANYQPFCYSNADPSQMNSFNANLYVKSSEVNILGLLNRFKLI